MDRSKPMRALKCLIEETYEVLDTDKGNVDMPIEELGMSTMGCIHPRLAGNMDSLTYTML